MSKRVLSIVFVVMVLLQQSVAGVRNENKAEKETMKVEIKSHPLKAISGIIYSQIFSGMDLRQLKMNIIMPQSEKLKPAIVFYPGGGFISANNDKFLEMRTALAQAGFVVASAEYRTVPDTYPGIVEDAKSAVRFLRAHAHEFGIDTTRIGVFGNSAGGYVAQMMGTTNGERQFDKGEYLNHSSDVQAAATIFGISNLLNIGEGYSKEIIAIHESLSSTESLLVNGVSFGSYQSKGIAADKGKALNASPVGHVKENMPPFLIMHGSADYLVSPVQSEQLYEALSEKHNKVKYVILENAGHGDYYWFQQPVIDKVVDWFKDNL